MAYAKRLTKERLIQEGFTEITKEGRLFKGEREIFPHWNGGKEGNRYLCIMFNQRDSEGHLIKGKDRVYKYARKDGTIGEYTSWNAKPETFGLHRVMWAWHYGEVPEGYVVDHINNKHMNIEDYHLDNLQLLTPQENVTKERECNVREIPCKLDRPRSYYEEKLTKYEALYEEAKVNKDADKAHHLRTNIAQTRARLRYYDNHREEAETLMAKKKEYTAEEAARIEAKKQSVKDRKLLEQYKIMFREAGNKGMWRQMIKVINAWDTLEQIQKDHVFDTLHEFFNKYGISF